MLASLFTLALALRLALIGRFGIPDIVGYSESGITAQNWVAGRGYSYDFYGTRTANPLQSFIPPLYTTIIIVCLRFAAAPATILYVVQALVASATVLILYSIARTLSGSPLITWLAALGGALYPPFIVTAAYPISLTFNTFFLALSLLATLRLHERMTVRGAALTGIAWGLAVLEKPILLGLLPLVLAWLWLNARRVRARTLIPLVVLVGGCALTLLPWTLRNFMIHQRLVLVATNGGFNFWNGNNPFTTGSGTEVYTALADQFLGVPHDSQAPAVADVRPYPLPSSIQAELSTLSEVELDARLWQAGIQAIRADPQRWLELSLTKLTSFWWFRSNIGAVYEAAWTRYYQYVYAMLLLICVPGVLLSLRAWRRYLPLYLVFGFYTLAHVAFHVQTRFRWEIEPYFLIFAALTVSPMFEWLRLHARPLSLRVVRPC